jgi:predicted GIY-YIG superfamily endonuclease
MKTGTCDWPIANGTNVTFDIYDKNEGWNHIAGLYIFSYKSPTGWIALYVGQTDDFATRIPDHERINEAGRLGATHIHATVVATQVERNRLEVALIEHLQPAMNTQHR